MKEESSVAHFIKYNNTIPIVLGFLFLSTSATLAASPEVQKSVYSQTQTTASVDNSYLVAANLDTFPFSMKITRVSEDDEYYYLDYDFRTIDMVDAVWKDTVRKVTLRISKVLLGEGDLQSYAESELAQVRAHEVELLTDAQERERKIGASQKVIATEYSGLIGKFVKPSTTVVSQYYSSENDPLALRVPQALVTWDENAEAEEPAFAQVPTGWPPLLPTTPPGEPTGGDPSPSTPPATSTPQPKGPQPPTEPEPQPEPTPEPEPQPEPTPEPEPAPTPSE